ACAPSPLLLSSPSPRSCGERVGVRGASANTRLADRPPHPDLLPLKGEKERRRRARMLARKFPRLVSACFFSLALSTPVLAQSATWPAKPIRLIVPLPAGSAVDLVGRLIGQKLG